jgi:hypothetical protein
MKITTTAAIQNIRTAHSIAQNIVIMSSPLTAATTNNQRNYTDCVCGEKTKNRSAAFSKIHRMSVNVNV